MASIKELQPGNIWKIFHELTQIPRPSKHETEAVKYAKAFGERLGLETKVDKTGNVVIRKPAVKGMENRLGVVLQAHLDMVPQKNSDKVHDFEKDPLETLIDGDWVKANGTTLGADNGIGVAAALAVLEAKDIMHGPVEVLLTVDEETGMTGAFGLEKGMLNGDILLNLDSEDEGELYIGCAGGMNTSGTMRYKEVQTPKGMKAYKLSVTGLKGGHSGLDIHLGRGNANKLMNRFLWFASGEMGLQISSIGGGNLRNAIPRESFAIVVVPTTKSGIFEEAVKQFTETFKSEFARPEPELLFKAETTDLPLKVMEKETQDRFLKTIYGIPNGVMRMSSEIEGMVETSLNLSVVKASGGEAGALCLLRSAVESAKSSVANMTQCVMELGGMEVQHDGNYPGWKPDPESKILQTMKHVYEKKYGKTPEVKVIHAGLECGIIGAVYPNLDMISLGPTIRHPHSPDEKVHIASVERFWEYLLDTMREVPVR